jgi:hypothetical protein
VLLIHPGSNGSANHLLQRVGVGNSFSSGLGKSLGNSWFDVVEDVVFFGKRSSPKFWPNHNPPLSIDHGKDRDKTFLSQNSTVLKIFFGYLANGFAVNVE